MRSRLALWALLFVAACNDDICSRHTDCAANQTCSTEGKCVGAAEASDAGTTDAPGNLDAGVDAPVDGDLP